MSKLGVGVGDEFPIDDGKPAGENAAGGPGNDPDREARRAEWRKQREAFREQRRQWRDQWRAEWRERKHAFKEEMRAQFGDEFDHDHCYGNGGYHRRYWRGHHLFQVLIILGLIMIGITLLNHIVVLFGLVVLAGLFFAYRGGFDHFDLTGSGPVPPAPPAEPKA